MKPLHSFLTQIFVLSLYTTIALAGCGEAKVDNLTKMLTMPQKPKVHSSETKPQDRWGYNKTTTETLFAQDLPGGRIDKEYDENSQKAAKKEAIEKQARKGSTVAITAPKLKVPKASKT